MRYISLFSGIEAASVAWEQIGFEPVAFSEIEPFPCAVLENRFPDVPNLGDITKVDWSGYRGAVDIIIGGSPCQSFSVAGKREGLAGASGLMFEYIRAVQEIRPRWFVWENVPGALSVEGGAAFGQLLEEMDGLGYGLAWRVLDAQFFGVAQRRRRVFLVGVFGDAKRAAEILFERESLRWDYPSSRDKREELAGTAWAGAGSYCIQGSMIGRSDTAGPQECGINDNVAFTLNTADRHAISYALNCRNQQVDENISGTILSKANGGYSLNYINPVFMAFQKNTRDEVRLINGDGDIAGALAASPGAKQQNYICMASGQANAEIGHDLCPAQAARQYKDPPIVVYTADGAKAVYHGGLYWVVRRLMPVECERLQGFPDGWTDIPFRGKPATDAPRYKALGNSMAVPVIRWLGERIRTY